MTTTTPLRPEPVQDAARAQLPLGLSGALAPGLLYLLVKIQTEQPITTQVLITAALLVVVPLATTGLVLRGTVATARPQVTPNADPRTPTGERLTPESAPVARPESAPSSSAPRIERRPTHRADGDVGESWPANASRDPARPPRPPRRDPEYIGGYATEPVDDDWTGATAGITDLAPERRRSSGRTPHPDRTRR